MEAAKETKRSSKLNATVKKIAKKTISALAYLQHCNQFSVEYFTYFDTEKQHTNE